MDQKPKWVYRRTNDADRLRTDEIETRLKFYQGLEEVLISSTGYEDPVNEKSSEESCHALAEDSGTSPTIESTVRTATDPSSGQLNEQSTASNIQSPALDCDEERSESITPNNVTGSNDWELADEFHAALGPELGVVRKQIRDVLQEYPVNEKSSEESYHALAEDSGLGTSPTIESTDRTATDPSRGQLNEQSTASNIQSPALDCDEERSESITPNNVTGSNDWELADEFHAALGPELDVVREQIRDVLQEGVILFPLELISRLYLRFGRRLPQLYEGYSSAKLLAWLKVNSGLDLNNLILMPPMTIVLNKDNSSTGNQN